MLKQWWQKRKEKYRKEEGAFIILTAFLLVGFIGLMVLAVDQGSWLSDKRKEQNAADAAAVAAAQIYANGGTADQAKTAALTAAKLNNMANLTSDELTITTDNAASPSKVTATISAGSTNYFYNNGTADNKTNIVATSVAEIYSDTQKGNSNPPGAAIEANNFIWAGGSSTATKIQGDIAVSNNITFNSPASLNGNVTADGKVVLSDQVGFTINGTVNAKNDITVTKGFNINGSMQSKGNILWNTDEHSAINGDVQADGRIDIQAANVNGSILSKNDIYFMGQRVRIKGDVKSETKSYINGGGYPIVDGVFYYNNENDLLDYQKTVTSANNYVRKSDGSLADFRPYDGQEIPEVSHTDYVWKWDSLAKTPDISYHVTNNDVNDFVNTVEVIQYANRVGSTWLGGGLPAAGGGHNPYYNAADEKNLTFKNAEVFKMFIDFVQKKATSSTQPIYFPGSVTVYNDGTKTAVSGFIVAKNNIDYQCPCDFTGVNTSFMSINGSITLGNGAPANITGAVICLNPGSNIQLNNCGGTITGGVISHGNLTMNGDWSIIADNGWKQYVPVKEETKTVKKIRIIS